MKKEALTTENIKNDLKKCFYRQIIPLIVLLATTPFLYIVLLNAVLLFYNPGGSFKTTFTIVFCAVCFIFLSCKAIMIVIGLRRTQKGDFTITSDWVVEKKHSKQSKKYSKSNSYRLIFARSGTYSIPYGISYEWSDLFATRDDTLYKYTDINEDFYVISVGAQKNIMAYRKKHFELKE